MEFDSISYKTLVEASRAALRNSQDFQYEADLLLRQKSFGHSKSLAILGIEEFGKFIGYWLLFRFKQFPVTGRINFKPDELLINLQKNHFTKQSIAFIFTILASFSGEEIMKLRNNLDGNGLTIDYNKSQNRFLHFENSSNEFITFKKWSKELELLPDLDKTKQSGLYVEIKDSINVNKPWKSYAKESKNINGVLSKLLSESKQFLI